MTQFQAARGCKRHTWERRLEVHRGVQCVVRHCLECGHRELCWSRRPLSLETEKKENEGYYLPTASG